MTTIPNPLTNLEQAVLKVLSAPLNTFLTALQQPNVNYQTVLQDFAALQLAVLQDEPVIQSIGISTIASYLQQELNAWIANVTPTPAA